MISYEGYVKTTKTFFFGGGEDYLIFVFINIENVVLQATLLQKKLYSLKISLNSTTYDPHMYSQLLRCSTAGGSSTGFSLVLTVKVQGTKYFLFT